MNEIELILKKFKRNQMINSWWLYLFNNQITYILNKIKTPNQTIGIFLNPITSNKERIRIFNYFLKKYYSS